MVKKKYEKDFEYDFSQMRSFEIPFNILYKERESRVDEIGSAHIKFVNKKIAETIYEGNYIDNSRNALKDMYLLLCDLGIYDDLKFEKKLKKTYG